MTLLSIRQRRAEPKDPFAASILFFTGLLAVLLTLVIGSALPTLADDVVPPDEGGFVESMGQPSRWMPYAGLGVGAYRPSNGDKIDATGLLTLGLFRGLSSPIVPLGLSAEGYVGAEGSAVTGGVRGLGVIRPLGLGLGVDYSIKDDDADLILTLTRSLRRGGLFGLGGRFRLDWLPTRDQTFLLGYMVPLLRPSMGSTRRSKDYVPISVPKKGPVRYEIDDPALAQALDRLGDAAAWINRFTTPFFDPDGRNREEAMKRFVSRVEAVKQHIAEKDALYPEGRTFSAEIRVYHDQLDLAFSLASTAEEQGVRETTALGREISAQAREILFDEVIAPYNRTLGRFKKPDTTRGFAGQARDEFILWLGNTPSIPPERYDALLHIYQSVLDVVEEARAESAKTWDTSQLVWLPIQLALRPEQMDSQPEFDALIERGVGRDFTKGNEHFYIANEQFQWEFLQHIYQAEDYHVLWIHDFRGVDGAKGPDQIGFAQVYHGYLKTLTERVRHYDETGKLPVYMIFLDQNFYEPNQGRIWMSLLQDPMHHQLNLGDSDEEREKEAAIAAAQAELRAAVAGSRLLQERTRRYGKDWLANRVKVHVNITNPVDWSYWSQWIIPVLGVPDVVMRDHRKISFYDVTETDPNKGEAIFTGMGIGEHYAGPTWEDRAILVSGPSLVGLKDAARQMLLNQGFSEDEIPYPLRPQIKPDDYGKMVAAREEQGMEFRAMQLHNQTGYAPKPINVAKATLYSALPADTILVVPDSLWNSPFWAGMLVGNALRGGRVYVVSPAFDNAPSAGFPQMSRAQEVFTELVVIRQMLGDEIAASGGSLNVGIYAVDLDVGDLIGRVSALYDQSTANPMAIDFQSLAPDDEEGRRAYRARQQRIKARVLNELEKAGFEPDYVTSDIAERKPKLHLKAQLFFTAEVEDALRKIDLATLIEQYFLQLSRQVHGREKYVDVRDAWKVNGRLWRAELERARAEFSSEEIGRMLAYLTVGSHNMDYRGTMMDGEVLYVTSGRGILVGFIDLVVMAGVSTWVEDLETLDELVPPYSEWQRRVGRFMKYLL